MNWASYKPEEFEGESYGQKDVEFMRFAELPGRVGEKFVLAMGQGPGKSRPTPYLESLGWKIIDRTPICPITPPTTIFFHVPKRSGASRRMDT